MTAVADIQSNTALSTSANGRHSSSPVEVWISVSSHIRDIPHSVVWAFLRWPLAPSSLLKLPSQERWRLPLTCNIQRNSIISCHLGCVSLSAALWAKAFAAIYKLFPHPLQEVCLGAKYRIQINKKLFVGAFVFCLELTEKTYSEMFLPDWGLHDLL